MTYTKLSFCPYPYLNEIVHKVCNSDSSIYILNSIIMKSLKEFIAENLENPTVQENTERTNENQENINTTETNENNENILKGQTDTAKTD